MINLGGGGGGGGGGLMEGNCFYLNLFNAHGSSKYYRKILAK